MEQYKKILSVYDKRIAERFNEKYIDADYLQNTNDKPDIKLWEELADDDVVFYEEFTRVITNAGTPEADDTFDPESFDDNYLNMELDLDRQGEGTKLARVTKWLKDKDGRPIGTASKNPILDSQMYEVEYEDGHKVAMAANAIASNLFAQVDQDTQLFVLFDEIIDWRTDGSQIKPEDAFIHISNGNKRRRETTKGW